MNHVSRMITALFVLALLIAVMPGCEDAPLPENGDVGEASSDASLAERGAPPADQSPEIGERDERPELADSVFQAILDDNEQLAIELVREGAPVKAMNDRDVTVLHFAVRASMLELTALLLEYGADANAVIPTHNHTPIHWASRTGAQDRPNAREIVDVLLEYGADINFADSSGMRPIDYAVRLDNSEWHQFMVSRGARPN